MVDSLCAWAALINLAKSRLSQGLSTQSSHTSTILTVLKLLSCHLSMLRVKMRGGVRGIHRQD